MVQADPAKKNKKMEPNRQNCVVKVFELSFDILSGSGKFPCPRDARSRNLTPLPKSGIFQRLFLEFYSEVALSPIIRQ
jgi:hypothetical protein